ncbi:hypothetical protein [Enterococcus avium]|uniref:hypothetical protein n=1 Tax=Enterococcus avium TaxID=33945 RepID=UPI001F59DDA9|nr:hypothetical protein [Enterococcus avium]
MKKIVLFFTVACCGLVLSACNSNQTTTTKSSDNKTTESNQKNINGTYSGIYGGPELVIDGKDVLFTDENGDSYTGTINEDKKKISFEDEYESPDYFDYKIIGNKIVLKSDDDVEYTLEKTSDSKNGTKESSDRYDSSETKSSGKQSVSDGTSESLSEKNTGSINIKPSPDKYTHYIKNYVGRNAASCGSERLNGNMMDDYGKASIELVFISENGEQVTSENAKDYVVTNQYPEPNTEIKLTFDTDENGKEYENLVSESTINEIELTVKPLTKD